jgi:hypothetical protein
MINAGAAFARLPRLETEKLIMSRKQDGQRLRQGNFSFGRNSKIFPDLNLFDRRKQAFGGKFKNFSPAIKKPLDPVSDYRM